MSHFTESPQVICHLQKMCSHDLRSTSAKSQRDSNNPVCMYVCMYFIIKSFYEIQAVGNFELLLHSLLKTDID